MISKIHRLTVQTLLESAQTEQDVNAIAANIIERAKSGDPETWLYYMFGKPRMQKLRVPRIVLDDLTTLDGCLASIAAVADHQANGVLADEDAESYRKTIRVALEALRTQRGEMVAQQLEAAGALSWNAAADEDDETNADRLREYFLANQNGN